MLDAVTLDQLRTFVAAAEQGSFSAAGRKIKRAQSVVSHTLANLELQLGVTLFDRSSRYPQLTQAGAALLIDAKAVIDSMDVLKARAHSLSEGLEPELSVAVDVMFPMDTLTCAVGYCKQHFEHTPLRLYVEALGGVTQQVMDGTCRLGIIGSLPTVPDELTVEPLSNIQFVTVVSPTHALARQPFEITADELSRHVQLILTDRTSLSNGRTFGVMSALTWRLADLGAKHAFLKAGFGWGHMPKHMVEKDIADGLLVSLTLQNMPAAAMYLTTKIVYRKDAPPGPAGRAFISQLKS